MRWLLIVAVIAVIACGGPSEEEYREDVVATVVDPLMETVGNFQVLMGEAERQPARTSEPDWRAQIDPVLATWVDANAKATELEPPDDLDDANQALLRATECFDGLARQITADIDAGAQSGIAASRDQLEACLTLVNEALDAINAA